MDTVDLDEYTDPTAIVEKNWRIDDPEQEIERYKIAFKINNAVVTQVIVAQLIDGMKTLLKASSNPGDALVSWSEFMDQTNEKLKTEILPSLYESAVNAGFNKNVELSFDED